MHMLWNHGMLSYYWFDQLMNTCDNMNDFSSSACLSLMFDINIDVVESINVYDIYGVCLGATSENQWKDNQGRLKFLLTQNPGLREVPACVAWEGVYGYLNSAAVRKALHINPNAPSWELCSIIDYDSDFVHGSLYTYPSLINAGLNILIYSGDVDGAVPTIGTRMWIKNLNLGILESYRSWMVNEQIAGYTTLYTGLRLVTIKGAGHMVPQWKPAQAHHMLLSWLFGTRI